jgi:thioredoxin 1
MPLTAVPCGALDAVLAAHSIVLLDVYTPHCGPCRLLAPVLEEVAAALGERVVVTKLDGSECEDVDRLAITAFPTLILFRDGEEIDRRVGAGSRPALLAWLEGALAEGA